MISALDISASGLVAQRVRMNAVASNLANISSLRDETGRIQPYAGREVIFQTDESVSTTHGAVGVKVASIETRTVEPNYRYQPDHPLAIREGKWQGYVAYPRINMTTEMVNALVAARAYEANIGAMEVSKSMGQQTLRILG